MCKVAKDKLKRKHSVHQLMHASNNLTPLSQISVMQHTRLRATGIRVECVHVWHLHVVEDTPSTVRVSGAQTLPASGVLLAALHRDSHHLDRKTCRERGIN